MKKTKEEKLEILNKISRPKSEKDKWQKIAEWNQDHAESLDDLVKIASRILETLKARDMTQKELAEKMDVSPQALTRIVKGRQNLTLQTIRKIEKALNISLITVHDRDSMVISDKIRFGSLKPPYQSTR